MVQFSADYSHELYGSLYKNIGGKGLFIPLRHFFIQQFPMQEFPLCSLPHQPLWPKRATKTIKRSIQLLLFSSKSCSYF